MRIPIKIYLPEFLRQQIVNIILTSKIPIVDCLLKITPPSIPAHCVIGHIESAELSEDGVIVTTVDYKEFPETVGSNFEITMDFLMKSEKNGETNETERIIDIYAFMYTLKVEEMNNERLRPRYD